MMKCDVKKHTASFIYVKYAYLDKHMLKMTVKAHFTYILGLPS